MPASDENEVRPEVTAAQTVLAPPQLEPRVAKLRPPIVQGFVVSTAGFADDLVTRLQKLKMLNQFG
jgi:hypothetical protein